MRCQEAPPSAKTLRRGFCVCPMRVQSCATGSGPVTGSVDYSWTGPVGVSAGQLPDFRWPVAAVKDMTPAGALRLQDGGGAAGECRPKVAEAGAPIPSAVDPGGAER
jgi:hypothetical protein